MSDAGQHVHDEIAELFSGYILGALPSAEMDRVAAHLSGCERCRVEFDDTLRTASALFDAGPVPMVVRDAIMGRLSPSVVTEPWPVVPDVLAAPPPMARDRATLAPADPAPVSPIPTAPVADLPPRRPTPIFGRAARAVLAVAAAAILALGGWAVSLQRDAREDRQIAALVATPAFAHFLTDTEAGSTAQGVIYVDPDDPEALVTARGLAPLPEGSGYQVWLFTETGQQVSGGFLPIDERGDGQALIAAPGSFADFWAVGLSAEPLPGSPSPTSPLALGGWIR